MGETLSNRDVQITGRVESAGMRGIVFSDIINIP
jgi:hypothetical protein